jgi:hypothetical protein
MDWTVYCTLAQLPRFHVVSIKLYFYYVAMDTVIYISLNHIYIKLVMNGDYVH